MVELLLQFGLSVAQLFKIRVRFRELVGDAVELGQQIDRLLDPLLDDLAYGPGFIQARLLLQPSTPILAP